MKKTISIIGLFLLSLLLISLMVALLRPKAKVEIQSDNFSISYSNLTMNCLGDSITYGAGGNGNPVIRSKKPYPTLLKEELDLKNVNNYGISGSTISSLSDSMAERYLSMPKADIVSVLGGVNDYVNGVKLGTINDISNTTVYGALNILASGLKANYRNSFIFFMTPLPISNKAKTTFVSNTEYTLSDVCNAVKEVCNKYGIVFFDTYELSGFEKCYDNKVYSYDGLHPTQKYFEEKLSPLIARFIRNNY